jgi:hypothetical protein
MIPTISVSWGELFDRITILEIKSERLVSGEARAHVRHALGELTAIADAASATIRVGAEKAMLKTVNEKLWTIEDDIRRKEAEKRFDAEFVELARAVYRTNDERARLKRDIDALLESPLREEKQYSVY